MSPVQMYTRHVLARWRLILALTVVGAVAAGVWSVTNAAPSWTATSALTTQSQHRSPEQDAVLALGYVDYFNQDSYQELLRSEVTIPDGVALTATTGATSPILYIQASGADEAAVREAAATASDRFQQDVRTSLVQERARAVGDVQAQVDEYVRILQEPERTDAEKNVILDQIRSMQGRISDIQSDNTNLLKPLQPEPGMASASASPVVDIVTGGVAGAVLGALAALLLTVLNTRMHSAADVTLRLGLPTVVELGPRSTASDRALRLEQLVNRLSLVGATDRAVIAVVGIRAGATAPVFACDLARTCAARQPGALLVLADLRRPGFEGRLGLVEVLDGWTALDSALLRLGGLDVLPPGAAGAREPYAVLNPGKVLQTISRASESHSLVVIDVPPLLDTSESQILCAAADQVLLVIEPGQTSLTDVRQAMALLGEVRADVGGVALIAAERDRPTEPEAVDLSAVRPATPAPTNDGSVPERELLDRRELSDRRERLERLERLERTEQLEQPVRPVAAPFSWGGPAGRATDQLTQVPDQPPSADRAVRVDEPASREGEQVQEAPSAVNEGPRPRPRPYPRPQVASAPRAGAPQPGD